MGNIATMRSDRTCRDVTVEGREGGDIGYHLLPHTKNTKAYLLPEETKTFFLYEIVFFYFWPNIDFKHQIKTIGSIFIRQPLGFISPSICFAISLGCIKVLVI